MTDRSKISKRNMQKSTAYQRKVAKTFEKFCKDAGIDAEFNSTPRSGGLRWQKRDDVIGDIVTPSNFMFTIECKKHDDIDLQAIFLNRSPNTTSDIINWWDQVCGDATRANRQPLLAFEHKRGRSIIVIPQNIADSIGLVGLKADEHTVHAYLGVDYPSHWKYVCLVELNQFITLVDAHRLFVE